MPVTLADVEDGYINNITLLYLPEYVNHDETAAAILRRKHADCVKLVAQHPESAYNS